MSSRTRYINKIIPTVHTDKQGKVWPGTMLVLSCGHRRHIGGPMLPPTVTWECGTSPCYVPGKDYAA